MSQNKAIEVEIDGHVAWLNLCRPERHNAMGMTFFKEVTGHFRRLDEDPTVRAVVIRAEGKSFTAGLDLMEAGAMLGGKGTDDRERLRKKIVEFQESNNAIERCRKPVIAAVHGHCIGGGVDLLSACDIRLASADALFSIRETRLAIIADLGTLQRLPHIIGQGWFRELALTGRDFTADEALQMGFVTRVCENREALILAAGDLAIEIAGMAPLTVQGVKEVINFSRDNGVYAGLSYVAQKNAAALPSEDLMEAVTAFMEKREPVFHGK
ncbi:crotonase/enoyl-CoA hydratase family protein [Desulfosarcina sp.]|uniref:crotonase/enoyl-CoA hydratase family protein n=1 Tax=Desulfosarcina sp. TaxID=2027861 RepID=UPI0029B0ECE1|nr:crotonase/enoyl-CoA hydratase family protein [Desulfosarcina sp.]MDX2452492.1 crotonase/enoyl-CoA hydratase family protein [Desulfosarcina sp.]MDX2490266.1 crotonase/enoyl-CoA hydratase family protein [Desulfosarcina sp.]